MPTCLTITAECIWVREQAESGNSETGIHGIRKSESLGTAEPETDRKQMPAVRLHQTKTTERECAIRSGGQWRQRHSRNTNTPNDRFSLEASSGMLYPRSDGRTASVTF